MCRNVSSPPKSVDFAVDRKLLLEARFTLFRTTIREALRRGARDLDLFLLKVHYLLRGGQPDPLDLSGLGSMVREFEEDWARSVIEEEERSFEWIIDEEMSRLKDIVGKPGLIQDRDDYRYRVRPLYYSAGYTEPADFLENVIQHQFLKFSVWIHKDLAAKLTQAEQKLGTQPGLAEGVTKEIREISGIQIRKIANSEQLSNHAFGLAIDVDPYSNPHVVDADVINALNWVVQQSGGSFDFGKSVLGKRDDYTEDDVRKIHAQGRKASDAVRDWLRKYAPQYRQMIAEIQSAEKFLKVKKSKPSKPIGDRVRDARATEAKMIYQAELESGDDACTPDPKITPETVAADAVSRALNEIASNPNLQRIQTLYENIEDTKYIETWEKRGLLTVPLQLAVVLVAELDLRWGEQYEKSKDAMHFELVGDGGQAHIAPDAPLKKGEKPRSLERLAKAAFPAERLRLPLMGL
jgi:hypothetical protein